MRRKDLHLPSDDTGDTGDDVELREKEGEKKNRGQLPVNAFRLFHSPS